jgi:phage N-6-adenine-methyltransferase
MKPDRNTYGTPDYVFQYLNKRYPFAWDLAATASNTKCQNFLSPRMDSLSLPWHLLAPKRWLWLNPPYRPLKLWIQKCQEERDLGAKIITLVPLGTVATRYFSIGPPQEIHRVTGRINFDPPIGLPDKNGNMWDSVVLVWDLETPQQVFPSFDLDTMFNEWLI